MLVGLVCAVGTSLCYGVGSVLQAVAARDADSAAQLDPRLLLRLLRESRYLLGLALDGVGFVLSLVALRSLPLYVVQSVVASFLAVTAVTGVVLLGTVMRKAEQVALGVVVLGLALVGLSAAPESAAAPDPLVERLLLASALVLVLGSLPLGKLGGKRGAWIMGGVAGMAFGVVAVSARMLSSMTGSGGLATVVQQLLESPATYALLVAAPLALMTYATALQRGSVVQATAPLVVGETVLPALVGLTLLGDHARPGWGMTAAVGFLLAVGAALLLSRFGDVSPAPSAG